MEVRYRHNLQHIPDWEGAKCDSTGFFQHYGECWNDSLQMILLYTDGIKELTQPLLFSTEITKKWVDEHIGDEAKGTRLADYMYYYLLALQRRFKRHYATETAVRRLTATCDKTSEDMRKAKLGIELFYRQIGVNAVQSAIYGSFRPNANTLNLNKYSKKENHPTHGRSVSEVEMLMKPLLKILGIETNLINKVQEPQLESTTREFMNPIPFPDTLRAIQVASSAHATAFYICGGKHFYYDDNTGPILFRWDKFLKSTTYEGIEEFIQADRAETLSSVGKFRQVVIPPSKAKSKKTREANEAFAARLAEQAAKQEAYTAQIKKQKLELKVLTLTSSGDFNLAYVELREGEFYHPYYPCIRIKNRLDETRFYTLSPITGEPRFYTEAEVKFEAGDLLARLGGTFHPIYVNSDAEITNRNYNFVPSEIRIGQKKGLRNSTEMNEYYRMRAVHKNFKPNILTRKANKRTNNHTATRSNKA